MDYEPGSRIAQSELMYISSITGNPPKAPNLEDIIKSCEMHNIQVGPNKLVLSAIYSVAKSAEEHEQHEMAKEYYDLLYNLSGDKNIKNKIDLFKIKLF
jgi:hypothetical protein